jgi:hypothetical protein
VVGELQLADIVTTVGLTWARNRSKTWKDDDPVILRPQQPTAVDEDKFTDEIGD